MLFCAAGSCYGTRITKDVDVTLGIYFAWSLLGFFVAAIGTLVGAGGGFILVPVLLYFFPSETADHITAISMAVILGNAFSGTLAYARMGRIDFNAGWRFALAALPGAFLGALASGYISRHTFDLIFGLALMGIALFLLRRAQKRAREKQDPQTLGHATFRLNTKGLKLGAAISSVVGFLSSFLGIGGGIIHVPAMVYLLRYPVHTATATSHFVLACTALVAVLEHIYLGSYEGRLALTLALCVGAILGAQVGARLSKHVNDRMILRGLGVALLLAGLRAVLRAL